MYDERSEADARQDEGDAVDDLQNVVRLRKVGHRKLAGLISDM